MLILAPGASAGQDHPGMVGLARALAHEGLSVITFDFPNTAAGKRRPVAAPVAAQAWRDVILSVRGRVGTIDSLFVGGRSMGGRIVTELVASDKAIAAGLAGVVCFGYPLRPPNRSTPRSLSHFEAIGVPILIVQGTRDSFGGPEDVRTAAPSNTNLTVIAVDAADHGLAVPKRAGRTIADVLEHVAADVRSWTHRVLPIRST
jgi:predicted alpha/beta-hydrolase family hydrolase